MSNEINNLSDSLKRLNEQTENLLDKVDNNEKINTTVQKNISKRFDSIARQAGIALQWRKETGSKSMDWFFEAK